MREGGTTNKEKIYLYQGLPPHNFKKNFKRRATLQIYT